MNPEENILALPTPLLERAILVPFRPQSAEEAETRVNALKGAAATDSHTVIAPTHVMMKGEKLLGYLSIAGLPNVHAWFDTKHPHALDSLKMIEMGELSLREKNITAYSLLCAEASPFTPHLERMGFTKLGTTVLYLKRL
jgi:hypothetical protein